MGGNAMKKIIGIFLFLSVGLLVSCGNKKVPKDEGKEAAKVAQTYYTALIRGEYDNFLQSEYRSSNLPDTYREGLLSNLKQFIERRTKEHRGIDSVSVASATFSAKDSLANAFLIMHFSDSTSEQIVVPMVKKQGTWLMR